MRELPLLMNGPMVRATLNGRKTVTRRLVKPQPRVDECGNFCWNGSNYGQDIDHRPHVQKLATLPRGKGRAGYCPYGQVGDRLYVRETFALEAGLPDEQPPFDDGTLKMDERDVRGGFLHVRQAKTGTKRRIEVVGELAVVLGRIKERKAGYTVRATKLIIGEDGQPLTYTMLYNAFRSARGKAGIVANDFQFRDLRAKAGTDKADSSGDIRQAQAQLGHTTVTMTEHYVRQRRGAKVTPTK